ncbi:MULTISPECIES: GntR family transcriptional regulator [Caproicibacterium]|jgi:DNA-binding transcriptional regulator YhcF (GntR family)|uniref:GntR family transcriptional regulator n=1 Tax=Caproicibacterium lactatifermentans TaxID=2666138 RepID=A0A859DRV4_9FIRM|nr:GntR family transcriptional regulator [Caproicibacterium lactatifermentans]ARP50744.1 GntR family transcriptional regulator [Ruminococcaceae bacterium CPB6]MDD4807015.1 GntR family transcriptional regulator [Oscillospiraceae bacterium]QKN23522.1 GntR family transcriptional regulator [Caproicibacterium lactatifermentans]QKO29799.1 GntR family transcriptional regulator [Caproicibacterium lactatifermentans]
MAWQFSSDRPIYTQLADQIKLRVVSGRYPAGSKLPSVRELAAEAAVNPNTMQRALSQLETEGLLFTQRTSGRFVTDKEETIMDLKSSLAQKVIQEFLQKMESLGFTQEDAAQMVQKAEKREREVS